MADLIAGRDLNEVPPSNNGFGTSSGANTSDGSGDGVTPCDPISTGDCALSQADSAMYPFPIIGENLLTYGNFAYGNSNAFQTELERRFKNGLMLHLSYTYLDQKCHTTYLVRAPITPPMVLSPNIVLWVMESMTCQ
jgi:hypothetical protein